MWGHPSPGSLQAGLEEYQGAGGSLRVWFCGMACVLEIRRRGGGGQQVSEISGTLPGRSPNPQGLF